MIHGECKDKNKTERERETRRPQYVGEDIRIREQDEEGSTRVYVDGGRLCVN